MDWQVAWRMDMGHGWCLYYPGTTNILIRPPTRGYTIAIPPKKISRFGCAMLKPSICPLRRCACAFPLSFALFLCPCSNVPFPLPLSFRSLFRLCSSKTAALIVAEGMEKREMVRRGMPERIAVHGEGEASW
eukprot:2939202-Rhodomonas_salina.1